MNRYILIIRSYNALRTLVRGKELIVVGKEHIPAHGPYIVVANHMNALDPIVVSGAFNPSNVMIHWVATATMLSFKEHYHAYRKIFEWSRQWSWLHSVFESSVMVIAAKSCSVIPVDTFQRSPTERNRVALFTMKGILQSGGIVGIFPEVKLTETRLPEKQAYATIAKGLSVPMIPVYVGRGAVAIGEPVFPNGTLSSDELSEIVMKRVYALPHVLPVETVPAGALQ